VGQDKLFHFAGHAFREIGHIARAADAYWRAGVASGRGSYPSPWGIRSIARAKVCFKDVGELGKSDNMHRLEWEARQHIGASWWQKPILFLWDVTSRYGTKPGRWLMSLLVVIVFSSIAYELMHRLLWIHQEQLWTSWFSAIYYCIVTMTTLGYGEFVPNHPVAQSFVVLNVIVGYFMLAVGVTILGRKILWR